MTQEQVNKMGIIERLSHPSPDIFKKIQYVCTIGGIITGGIGGYILNIRPESRLGTALLAIGGFCTFICTLIAKLPVDTTKINQSDSDNNLN